MLTGARATADTGRFSFSETRGRGRLIPLWSVGFMGADSKTEEEQREGVKNSFRNDSTFTDSGFSGPVSTQEKVSAALGFF